AASGHRARRPSLPRDRAAGCEVPPSRRSCVLRDMLGGNAASGRHTHDTSNTKTQILTFIPNPLSRKNKKPAEGGLDSSGPITGSARRVGSPGWIRTTECLSQSQVPYHLATGLQ